MINCIGFHELLKKNGINFYAGVPDSLLQDFCSCIGDREDKRNHIIAANEGNAAAIAAGRHLSTGETPLVYMQNSGLGNIVNPMTSLLDPMVYSIPTLFLIGWRGEPGITDEPQHIKQGEITLDLLDTLGIKYSILPRTIEALQPLLAEAVAYMKWNNAPFALVVSKGGFQPYVSEQKESDTTDAFGEGRGGDGYPLTREEVLKLIIDQTDSSDVIVSTTGKTSREIFEYREEQGGTAIDKEAGLQEVANLHSRDFLTVGSMGHSSQIALGIALSKPNCRVYCIDGDGALIMHMGSLAIIGDAAPENLIHIVINNGAHESVGGQPTAAFKIDIPKIAKACGYPKAVRAVNRAGVKKQLKALKETPGPALLEIRVRKGARSDLGRPTTTPVENKKAFMEFLRKG